jgi:hypothetical protein
MMRQNPTDPASFSAIEGDTKIPDPVNRTQISMLRKDMLLPSTEHKMKARGFSLLKVITHNNGHIGLIFNVGRILIP